MKTFILRSVCLVCLVALTGCTNYWANRGRDAADVLTLTVGKGFGAKARVGVFQAGLLADDDLGGLRGGAFLTRKDYWNFYGDQSAKRDDVILVFGRDFFLGNNASNLRGKSYDAHQFVLSIPFSIAHDRDSAPFAAEHNVKYNPWPYMTQVEAVGGIFYTVRVGANPVELLDFVLGWTTLDICGDDVGLIRKAASNNAETESAEQGATK